MIAYFHPQKARLEPIAGTTDLEVMMGICEVEKGAPGNDC